MIVKKKTNNFDFSLDLIRSIAIVGTIITHSVHEFFARTDYLGGTTWWLAAVLNTLGHTAVPLFVMVSGALMYPKINSSSDAIRRVTSRLLLPLFFWSLLTFFWNHRVETIRSTDYVDLLSMFIFGNLYIFYFLIILIGLYLVSPFIKRYVDTDSSQLITIKKIMILAFFIGFCELVIRYFLLDGRQIWNSISLFLPYVGYYLVGHLLYSHRQFLVQKQRKLFMLTLSMFVLNTVLTYANLILVKNGNYILWLNNGAAVQFFDEYFSPAIIGLSVGFYACLLSFGSLLTPKVAFFKLFIRQLAAASFGMYLVHSLVLDYLRIYQHLNTTELTMPLMQLLIVRLVGAIVISFGISLVALQIPIVNLLFGARINHLQSANKG